ncbi:MAG: DUF4864 domain-containing protein [Granulosicoccus sp.]|nr:DUF4864 domain-containing protein [Granulosicoccus sp.]
MFFHKASITNACADDTRRLSRSRAADRGGLLLPAFGLLTGVLLLAGLHSRVHADEIAPHASLTPQQVVRIVIDSLKFNDESNDAGIATVFRFASPGNKAATGPLPRFTQMIKRGFPDMLNHAGARFEPMQIDGLTALQVVWLLKPSGQEVGYAFQLGKQTEGNFQGVWMTEAVAPLGAGSGIRI